MREGKIQDRALLAAGSRPDVRLWRNHVGKGWTGHHVSTQGEYTVLRNARRCAFGLAVGSADLIGIRRVTITPEMVGREMGVFISAEAKQPGKAPGEDQRRWARVMRKFGAICGVFTSPDEAVALVSDDKFLFPESNIDNEEII